MYDALVIGAGPAGAAAAWALSRAGRRVALVDRERFPRDKTCGDGLIADSLSALDAMGLRGPVAREAVRAGALHVHAPDGTVVPLAGEFLCLPRYRLDALLVDAAVAAGAELMAPVEAREAIETSGQIAGARCVSPDGRLPLEARVTLLAAGANATVARSFGLAAPMKPNAVAGRAYFKVPERVARSHPHLSIVYERSLLPGYGWIFPGPDRCYNVGVGFFSNGRAATPSLHDLWERFTTRFAPAADLVASSERLTAFRGAPLRIGLQGAVLGRPGLLVLGDAAAMTYPATGEGIGKAMQSGLLAAELVAGALSGAREVAKAHIEYEREFRSRFSQRYRAYWTAQAWSSRPWLLNLLAARATRGRFVREELEGLVAERGNAQRLLSVSGLVRALFK